MRPTSPPRCTSPRSRRSLPGTRSSTGSTCGWSSTAPRGRWKGSGAYARRARSTSCCPATARQAAPSLLDANERYIHDFMDAAATAASKHEAVAKMLETYGDYDLPVILDFGMQAAVEGRSYPDIMQRFLRGES